MSNNRAHESLIRYGLGKGMLVTVSWEDEVDLDKSSDFHAIVDAVESTDSPVITFYKDGVSYGSASILVELDDSETVSDFTPTPFIDEWFDKFIDGEL